MQSSPCASGGTDASTSAENGTCVHQHGNSALTPAAMAHWFDSPHSGHKPVLNIAMCCYCTAAQPAGLKTRSVEAGNLSSLAAGRRGRATNSPPQLGHCARSTPLAHGSQNVHSKEQMRASADSGGRSRLQHSQFGRSLSIADPCLCCLTFAMSGDRKPAQPAGGRPLDGGVRAHVLQPLSGNRGGMQVARPATAAGQEGLYPSSTQAPHTGMERTRPSLATIHKA